MDIFLGSETYSTAGNLCSFIQRDISKTLKEKILMNNYGDEFVSIAIIPIIMPEKDHAFYPERRLIKRKSKEADIRLYVNYDKFTQGIFSFDDEEKVQRYDHIRKLLLIKNIIDSIMVVENRKKYDFHGIELIKDIMQALNVIHDDLRDI